jgi:hypothetical protein
MTADTLCHQISSLSIESIPGVEEIYPLLASRTKGVQQGAFEVLHQIIPKAQEQVSFEAALSKGAVSLPDELLSLLLEAPTLGYDAHGETQMWIGLRSYLLSWKIVFDHFTHAVSKTGIDYSCTLELTSPYLVLTGPAKLQLSNQGAWLLEPISRICIRVSSRR